MALTVTAAQSGVTKNGLILRVRVLVGSDTVANINAGTGKGTQSATAAHSVALTTTRIGSVVWSAIENGNAGANNPVASNSSLDDVPDATNAEQYGTIFQTTPTVTPGAFTAGSADSFPGGCASLEILPLISGGTISYDASGPALASTTAATTVTTASFTPPAGTVLMALVSSAGGAGVVNMTVSDSSGLTWTAVVQAHATSQNYAGIWLATIPLGGGMGMANAQPGDAWLNRFRPGAHARRTIFLPSTQYPGADVPGALPASVTVAAPVGTVSVGVAGLVGAVTVAAPLGTVTGSAALTGVVGAVTVTAPVGTVTVAITGAVAASSVAAPVGTVKVAVTGQVAAVTASAPLGTITGTAVLTGQVAAVAVASPLGTVTTKVTGQLATVTVAAPLGIVNTTVTGQVAAVTTAAPLGTVMVAVTGLVGAVTVSAPLGTVTTTGNVSITGVVAGVTVASPLGTITGTAALTGVVASVTVAAPLGTVKVGVTGVLGHVTVAAPLGSITSTATVTGVLAQVSVSALIGTVTTSSPRHPLALGGTELDENTFGGIAVADRFDGLAVADKFDGAADFDYLDGTGATTTSTIFAGTANDENTYGGVPSLDTFGGTQIGWTMQAQNITIGEFNDESIDVAITQNASAFNLTGFDLNAYFKVAAGDLDSAGTTLKLSSTGGSPAITITNTAGGLATIVIAKTNLQNANYTFWRVDVVNHSTSLQNTAIYGTVTTRLL